MLQVPVGKIRRVKNLEGIQKEGWHKGGMLFYDKYCYYYLYSTLTFR